ncbi:MAG TPA: hypothetical protein VNF69_15565 [Burkholderiales bacterium]|nr:hypothetical protein [Burkholderiales bacterium]
MRKTLKSVIAGSVLALASGSALAHGDIGLDFSIAVPGASAYVGSTPAYYPPAAYAAPPAVYYGAAPETYYAAPPQAYYAAPPQAYYAAPPAVSVYYGPSREQYRHGHYWHRWQGHEDDDD